MPCPMGLHRRMRGGGHLLMRLAWKYLSTMKVQVPDKEMLLCLCQSTYLSLILSLKDLPKVHLSFNSCGLEFDEALIAAY